MAYEARNGIADRLICRECFEILRDGELTSRNRHLRRHGWNQNTYDLHHPGAPRCTSQRNAASSGHDVEEVMAERADKYVTPEVRATAVNDPKYEEHNGITGYVICRVPRCGFKSNGHIRVHLRSQHDKEVVEYRQEHKWPEIISMNAREQAKERSRRQILALRTAAQPQKAKPGPHSKSVKDKEYFKVGKLIEEKLAAGMELTTARRLVAKHMDITYSSAVRYHKRFRKSIRSTPPVPVTQLRA